MIGKTNIGNGSSLSFRGALLCITAPTGSTITLIKNNLIIKVLYPKDQHIFEDGTKAYWYYSVSPSNYGEWTVTATLGTDSVSDTVTIDAAAEYDIVLSYGVYLFNNGDQCIAVTGGWVDGEKAASGYTVVPVTISTAIGYSYSSATQQSFARTNNKIALYNGDIIRVNCSFTGKFSVYVVSLGTTDWYTNYTLAEYVSTTTSETVHELAITSNMEGYVYIGAYGQNAIPVGSGSITKALIVRS